MQRILKAKNPQLIGLLVFLIIIFSLELKLLLTTPIAFGDEGFHLYLSKLISQERKYFVWLPIEGTELIHKPYARPPLWNLLAASVFLMGGGEGVIKFILPFIAIITGMSCYLLVKRLINLKAGFFAAILFITIPSFVTYSVLFYTDVLYTLYATLTFLTFLLAQKEKNKKYFFLSGIFASLAILTKAPGFGFYAFFVLAFVYEIIKTKTPQPIAKKYALLILPLLLIPGAFFLRNLYYYDTFSCYRIPYVSDIIGAPNCKLAFSEFEPQYKFVGKTEQIGSEASVYKMGLINYLQFAYGALWLVPFAFLCGILLIATKREWFTEFLFLYLILFLLLFPTIVRRAEDTARFTLGWIPLIAMTAGIWCEKVYEFLRKQHKFLVIILLIFILVFAFKNLLEKLTIMERVKKFSPTFFEACDWVKNNIKKNSSLYTIWAHRAVYNCQRNAIPTTTIPDLALSRNISYILKVAEQNGVTHLFVQKFSIDPQNRHFSEMYDLDWVQFLENNPQEFVKIYDDRGLCILRDWKGRVLDQKIANNTREVLSLIKNGYYCDGNVIYEINYTKF